MKYSFAQKLTLNILEVYRNFFSPDHGFFRGKMRTCVFYPSCSEYSRDAVIKYGAIKGLWLTTKRIIQCNPWQKRHIDIP